ncbi:SGNH/GDSL hydrolase family protein [Bartonella sp. LJL80]
MGKTVLAFGDSLTWGLHPSGLSRHAPSHRWPCVLKTHLPVGIDVIEEGLCGRTTVFDDMTVAEERNGARVLPTILGSHQPVDLIIIMLGTNDLKSFIAGSAVAASFGMRRLVQIVRSHPYMFDIVAPDILLVAPPHLVESGNPYSSARFNGALGEAKKLSMLYSDLADELECAFFDAASVAVASPLDGVHLDENNTKAIGKGLAPLVSMILGL